MTRTINVISLAALAISVLAVALADLEFGHGVPAHDGLPGRFF